VRLFSIQALRGSGYHFSSLPNGAHLIRDLSLFILATFIAIPAAAADHDLEANERGVTAVGRPVYSLKLKHTVEKLDFDFHGDESTAWINGAGDFAVGGWVAHRGFLCATYRMGIRFGVGSPACLNVQWIGEPLFVTSHIQCNGARVMHQGGDNDKTLGASVGQITCAERIVRCIGSCN
jgi:hypothetical protein